MELIAKIGAIAALGSLAVPTTLVSTRGSRYSLFEEAKDPDFVPAKTNNAHGFLTERGYHTKSQDKLADFNKGRDVQEAQGNFGLGCNKVIFDGKDVLRLKDTDYLNVSGNFKTPTSPINDHFEKGDKPILGCSTASIMDSRWGKVYDFELSLKKGDKGFTERISVFDGSSRAISQIIFYRKNHDPKTSKAHPWKSVFGLQRIVNNKNLEIGNPIKKTWTALDIKNWSQTNPIYFSVWISDPKESTGKSSNPGMMEHLGIRFNNDKKLFSSVAQETNDQAWFLRLFKSKNDGLTLNPETEAYLYRYKPSYTSSIAKELADSKGIWKDVKVFCEEQKSTKYGSLNEDDVYRLRDYCYTK